MGVIRLCRVYEQQPRPAGKVFSGRAALTARLRRDALDLDGWLKDVAPSTELRRWFGHDPAKWQEFRRRYVAELDARPHAWRPLAEAVAAGEVTLLYSSRDREHNNAVVLADYLRARAADNQKG